MTLLTRRAATILTVLSLAAAPAACGGDEEAPAPAPGGEATPQAGGSERDEGAGTEGPDGRGLFASTCGTCHTLEAAGTSGTVGPNLDELQPDVERVREAIRTGPGTMPENLYEGAEADAVAEYVAENAGG